jgi:hypothetical protein
MLHGAHQGTSPLELLGCEKSKRVSHQHIDPSIVWVSQPAKKDAERSES